MSASFVVPQQESVMEAPCKQTSDRLYCDVELGRKLAVAELEVLQLHEFLKQATQKYTEDIRKLEEKVNTCPVCSSPHRGADTPPVPL